MWTRGANGKPYSWENPSLAKYYKDWQNGKIVIPGLKVSIKDVHGNEYGPSTCKLKERVSGKGYSKHAVVESAVFVPLSKVRLG